MRSEMAAWVLSAALPRRDNRSNIHKPPCHVPHPAKSVTNSQSDSGIQKLQRKRRFLAREDTKLRWNDDRDECRLDPTQWFGLATTRRVQNRIHERCNSHSLR